MTRSTGIYTKRKLSKIFLNIEIPAGAKFLAILIFALPMAGCFVGSAVVHSYSGRWQGRIVSQQLYDQNGKSYEVAAVLLEHGTSDYREMSMTPSLGYTTLPLVADDLHSTISIDALPAGTYIDVSGKIMRSGSAIDPGNAHWLTDKKFVGRSPSMEDPKNPLFILHTLQFSKYKVLAPATAPSARAP